MCMTSHALYELLAAIYYSASDNTHAKQLKSCTRYNNSSVVSLYMYTPSVSEPHPFPCRPASHFMTGST